MQNLKLAIRTLAKTPFVTAVAIASLALGIGANAAIFSMFNQLLLKPLPVAQPNQLVNLSPPGPIRGSNSCNQSGGCDEVFSYRMFRDLESSPAMPVAVAAHKTTNVSIAIKDEPSTGQGSLVSGSYFPVLGLTAAKGRLLIPDDDRTVGANFVTVISYAFWQTKLGGAENVVGQTIVINGKPFAIVGVAPEGFDGTTAGNRIVAWIPITMRAEIQRFTDWENRSNYWIYVFGRLKPGETIETATRKSNAIYSPIINDVEAPRIRGMSDQTMVQFRAKKLVLQPGERGQSRLQGQVRTPLILLFSVTGVVLLIACANIANLLLARGASRATEMGVRLAIGATRSRLIIQLLTESVLLAAVGGVASLFVAQGTLRIISSILPVRTAASMGFSINTTVIIFSAVISLATGLLFGLFPALQSTRTDLISTIRAGAGQIAGGGSAAKFRNTLVTAQIALSMGLLITSALFLKSLMNVSRVDLGVKIDNVATFDIVPMRSGYDSARSALLLARVEQELAATPGVTGVADAAIPLLSDNSSGGGIRAQGFDCGPDTDCDARVNEVGVDYFKTFGVRTLAGREFTTSDNLTSQRVVVVNEAFVKKFKMGTVNEALGKFMGDGNSDSVNIQIVGVVPNVKYSSVKDSIPAVYYRPWRQDSRTGSLYYYVRAAMPPENMLGTIRTMMKSIDSRVPVEELRTMPQQVDENVFLDRMISILSSAFALLATLLAGVGLYGVLSYSVAQRTREIGVRMALGASASDVRKLVMRQVTAMLAIGGVIGIIAALGIGRTARSLLFELGAQDPVAILMSVALLSAVALVAGLLPARKAARTDPMHALRYD